MCSAPNEKNAMLAQSLSYLGLLLVAFCAIDVDVVVSLPTGDDDRAHENVMMIKRRRKYLAIFMEAKLFFRPEMTMVIAPLATQKWLFDDGSQYLTR